MTGLAAIAFAKEVIPLLMLVINGVVELAPVVREGLARLQKMNEEGRDPTPEDWDWINGVIADRRARVRAKLSAP